METQNYLTLPFTQEADNQLDLVEQEANSGIKISARRQFGVHAPTAAWAFRTPDDGVMLYEWQSRLLIYFSGIAEVLSSITPPRKPCFFRFDKEGSVVPWFPYAEPVFDFAPKWLRAGELMGVLMPNQPLFMAVVQQAEDDRQFLNPFEVLASQWAVVPPPFPEPKILPLRQVVTGRCPNCRSIGEIQSMG